MEQIKAGFVGFGSKDFPREVIDRRSEEARKGVQSKKIELVSSDPVSTLKEADRAVEDLKKGEFDFLILCIASWVESPLVMAVAREFSHKPILLWGLGGYTRNGSLVSPASQAGTTGLREPLDAAGFKFKYIYDWPDSPMSLDKVDSFAQVARAVKKLAHARVGMMGYGDMGLYVTMFDGLSLRGKIGPEVEAFDMLEITQKMEKVSQDDISSVVERMKKEWKFQSEVADEILKKVARIYLAFKERIKEGDYEAISIKCVEGMKKYMNFPPCMILTLLADEVTAICEDDALSAVNQLMIKYLTGQPAPYVEIYEFMKDRILTGVCGFVPSGVVEGPVCVTGYGGWGGLSAGVMNVSKMRTGRITISKLFSRGDQYKMHIVTGEGLSPRKWEELGWSPPAPRFPSLEIVPDIPVEEFAQKVASQHYLVAYGDQREKMEDLCNILGIEIV